MGGKHLDLTGMKFNRLTVLKVDEETTKVKKRKCWLCECDCGTIKSVPTSDLKSGKVKSCGCYMREVSRETRTINLLGQQFGRLTVIERSKEVKSGGASWICQCECGNIITATTSNLKSGKTKSCGCFQKEQASKNCKDLVGQKFGRLTVIEKTDQRGKGRRVIWLCKCECGNTKLATTHDLKNGDVKSCGCIELKKENNPAWKGGITPISSYLRSMYIVKQWKKKIYEESKNMCQLTGKIVNTTNSDVHHLKSFNIIVKEAHENNNIRIRENINEYTNNEIKLLEEYIIEWHKDTTNGILLSEEVHKQFHEIYGYGNNTLEQFEEFANLIK